MFKNHIKIALRSLLKNKLFTSIKLIGLTVGLTAALLIGPYLHHEQSFDAFHEKSDRIARVTMEAKFGGELVSNIPVTGNKVAPSFRQDFPEVEDAVRLIRYTNVVKYQDRLFEEKEFYYADSSFFNIFSFPLLAGDPATALNAPNKVVITTQMAKKYFGSENPIGKQLTIDDRKEYVVSGLIAPAPTASQLQPDFIGSFTTLRASRPEQITWWTANYATYVLLYPGTDIQTVNQKIPAYMAARTNETGTEGDDYLTYKLEPLEAVHLHSEVPGNFVPNGDKRYIYMLGIVAFLILLIGSITYINLTIAQSTERAKEIGVQKVLGISRPQLFGQHIGEAIVLTGIALVISYVLAILSLPFFNSLVDRTLSVVSLFDPFAMIGVGVLGILIGFLAGAWPALVVSKFKPVTVLKGNYKSSTSGSWLQKSLIVLQFGISVFLIICMAVLHQQMDFIQGKKLGYDKDHVLSLPCDSKIVKNIDAIKSEMLQHSHVHAMSLAYESPVDIDGGYGINKNVNGKNAKPVKAIPADEDFVKTLNLTMVAGSDLAKADIALAARMDSGQDSTSALPILINESQCAALGWSPDEAINQFVGFQGRAQIKGVFNNFHFKSLHEPVGNLVVFPFGGWGESLLVKLSGQEMAATLSFLESKWSALVPHRPFSFSFLDEELEQMYASERQTSRLVTTFSLLAILLACMGLFGIASYNIVQRTKEIGVRKVLGASTANIMLLLSKNFLLLVAIGLLLAAPVSWYLMRRWLEDFTYHIDMAWWMFVLPGLVAVVVAFLTISVQSIQAALNNPVESLRAE